MPVAEELQVFFLFFPDGPDRWDDPDRGERLILDMARALLAQSANDS